MTLRKHRLWRLPPSRDPDLPVRAACENVLRTLAGADLNCGGFRTRAALQFESLACAIESGE